MTEITQQVSLVGDTRVYKEPGGYPRLTVSSFEYKTDHAGVLTPIGNGDFVREESIRLDCLVDGHVETRSDAQLSIDVRTALDTIQKAFHTSKVQDGADPNTVTLGTAAITKACNAAFPPKLRPSITR